MPDATIRQARSLRRRAPETETQLWKLLRDRKLADLKFRRQVPLGPYVVDFLCLRHRLIVEADGPFHDPEHDRRRDDWLTANGFRVLRFSNSQINSVDHHVQQAIMAAIGLKSALDESPSPLAGEGGDRQVDG
jgi:very-short-patch-repair endonuclease